MRRLLPLALIAFAWSAEGAARDKWPRAEAVRDCRTHVEGRLPRSDPRLDLRVGPVRFRGFRAYSRRAARGRPVDWFEIRDRQYHSLKMVTEVRAGTDVTVAIGRESRRTAGLLYKLDVPYGEYGIPFGSSQRSAQCLRLQVHVRGERKRRFVEPFGRSRRSCRHP
jgi:hypothetical protein